MDDEQDDEPIQISSFEVRTDPWAMARRYEPPERLDVLALGFEHIGFVFERVKGIDWERAEVGFTSEVFVDPDQSVFCHVDLYFDHPIIRFSSMLEDGTILITRRLPPKAVHNWISALTFASRPGAGRYTVNHAELALEPMWHEHRDRVRAASAKRGSPVAPHDGMDLYFAIDTRGLDISEASAPGVLKAMIIALVAALAFLGVGVVGCLGWFGISWWLGAASVALFTSMSMWPWVPLAARLTRLERVPAAALRSAQRVQDKLGDHTAAPGAQSGPTYTPDVLS